jgi:hypothetical protein
MQTHSKKAYFFTMLFAALACVVIAGSATAHAVPTNQVLRIQAAQTFTGVCCFSWGETVSITEPAAHVPVVVTWSSDYVANAQFSVGIMLNGGSCQFYGSGQIAPYTAGYNFRTFQAVILPSDGLVTGKNTFTLCGGSQGVPSDSISLGYNTLVVQISK